MSNKKTKIPQSAFGRSLRILGSGATILAREAGGRLRRQTQSSNESANLQLRLDQARDLVATLSQLKGAAMKAGQLLSVEFSDFLPAEVIEVLRQLHDEAPSLDQGEIQSILLKELGPDRIQLIEDLSSEAIAAASIGQVHSATVAARPHVIKVQFPGVAQSIDSDIAAFKTLSKTFMRLQNKKISLDEVFVEVRRSLKKEVDYLQEANALKAVGEAFAGDSRFLVPVVREDLTTKRVLTMTRMEGLRLKEWLATGPNTAARNRFGQLILELLLKEFLEVGLVQTDPNFGNFLYNPKDHRLALLDFGATQKFSKKFRRTYRELLKTCMTGDSTEILAVATPLFELSPKESPEVAGHFLTMMRLVVKMFEPINQPFSFADLDYLNEVREVAMQFAMSIKYSPPPKQLIFLNRKLGGMFHLLKEVDCTIDMTPYWQTMVAMDLGR